MRVSNDENAVFVSGTLGGAPEHVPLTIPGRNLAFMPNEGERLSVWGQLRTYNRHTEQGTHLCVTVFAKGIEPLGEEEMPQNEVSLSGYLCKPAVFRTTPFLREIGDMLIACNRSFNKSDYLPCIAWGRNARTVSELPVGSRLYIQGRIQSRRYQKQLSDGTVQDRTAHEVSCSSIELL